MSWKMLLAVLGSVILIALTAACGGSSTTSPTGGETADQESATEAAQATQGPEEEPTAADQRQPTPAA